MREFIKGFLKGCFLMIAFTAMLATCQIAFADMEITNCATRTLCKNWLWGSCTMPCPLANPSCEGFDYNQNGTPDECCCF